MNFYLLSVFVILCFGPCTIAREVYQRFTKNSAETTDETPKRLNGEAGSPIIINGLVQVTSQARTWIQWLRRLLKALRKWFTSHPHEVKLGKCFASYFNIRIPGMRQYGQNARQDEKETQYLPKISNEATFPPLRTVAAPCPSQKRIFRGDFLEKNFIFPVRNVFIEIRDRFRHYRDVLLGNTIAVCAWDYFWKKFWTWIDSTPDSLCQI